MTTVTPSLVLLLVVVTCIVKNHTHTTTDIDNNIITVCVAVAAAIINVITNWLYILSWICLLMFCPAILIVIRRAHWQRDDFKAIRRTSQMIQIARQLPDPQQTFVQARRGLKRPPCQRESTKWGPPQEHHHRFQLKHGTGRWKGDSAIASSVLEEDRGPELILNTCSLKRLVGSY